MIWETLMRFLGHFQLDFFCPGSTSENPFFALLLFLIWICVAINSSPPSTFKSDYFFSLTHTQNCLKSRHLPLDEKKGFLLTVWTKFEYFFSTDFKFLFHNEIFNLPRVQLTLENVSERQFFFLKSPTTTWVDVLSWEIYLVNCKYPFFPSQTKNRLRIMVNCIAHEQPIFFYTNNSFFRDN